MTEKKSNFYQKADFEDVLKGGFGAVKTAGRMWVFANAKTHCEESVSSSTPQNRIYLGRFI